MSFSVLFLFFPVRFYRSKAWCITVSATTLLVFVSHFSCSIEIYHCFVSREWSRMHECAYSQLKKCIVNIFEWHKNCSATYQSIELQCWELRRCSNANHEQNVEIKCKRMQTDKKIKFRLSKRMRVSEIEMNHNWI